LVPRDRIELSPSAYKADARTVMLTGLILLNAIEIVEVGAVEATLPLLSFQAINVVLASNPAA
jgi:hypothetical protein